MKFLREPLVHFLIIGAALFAVFGYVGQWNIERQGQLVVSAAQIDALRKSFDIDFGRWPTQDETGKLVDDWVREEILVREAEKIQFQHDNQAIRRLMRQHMESIDEGNVEIPTDAQLQAFVNDHPEMFRQSPGDPLPPLEQIKPAVQNAWMTVQRKVARDAAYDKIKSHYSVVIETAKPSTMPATEK